MKRVGRPPDKISKKAVTFCIRVDLLDELKKKPNMTKAVNEALALFFNADNQEIYNLEHEIKESEERLNIKKKILSEKRKIANEEERKRLDEEEQQKLELNKKYHIFIEGLKETFKPESYYLDGDGGVKRFNLKYGTDFCISKIKVVVDSILNDTYSFDEYLSDFKVGDAVE